MILFQRISTYFLLFYFSAALQFAGCTQPPGRKSLEEFKNTIVQSMQPEALFVQPISNGNTSCTAILQDNKEGKPQAAAIAGDNYRWKVLYVYIDSAFDDSAKFIIYDALKEIDKHICVDTWLLENLDKASELDYVRLKLGKRESGCFADVGKKGGEQVVNLESPGCIRKESIMHEIMHALGYWHEQSRPDRDDFVEILSEFIIPDRLQNFRKESSSLTFRLPYDQNSIMHYPATAFSADGKSETIVAKNKKPVGNDNGELTNLDIKKLKIITRCPDLSISDWQDGANGMKWNFDCDFYGNDISSFTNTVGEDCGNLCSKTSECARFTWRPINGGTCWLKNGAGNSTPSKGSNADGVCGFIIKTWRDAESGAKWDFNCDFYGNDMEKTINVKRWDCGILCLKNVECQRFTWRSWEGGTCWVKTGAGDKEPVRGTNTDGICGFFENIWRDGEKGSKWDYNCDFYGNDFEEHINVEKKDCGSLCLKISGCARFTWRNWEGGKCWLKNGAGSDIPQKGNNSDGICGFVENK